MIKFPEVNEEDKPGLYQLLFLYADGTIDYEFRSEKKDIVDLLAQYMRHFWKTEVPDHIDVPDGDEEVIGIYAQYTNDTFAVLWVDDTEIDIAKMLRDTVIKERNEDGIKE